MCLNIHPFLLDIPVHIQNIIHNVMLRQFIQISLLYTKFNFQSSAYFVYINRIETNKIETELKTNKQKIIGWFRESLYFSYTMTTFQQN